MDYDFKNAEKKWQLFWEKEGIYRFKKGRNVYSVDTPPPTLSGMMHLGHAFSYAQQDFMVRYHRMKGDSVFYPFGTDDNGLPTERMVEKLKNVGCNDMSRDEFVRLCEKTINELREEFIADWKLIGMSCDFSRVYSTIDKHCIKTSQKSFIDLYKKNFVYRHEAPTMWCVRCQTAIAQAELEDEEMESFFLDVVFELDKEKIIISTTRPELLGGCVCIFVHPDDERYRHLVGKKAIVPLFKQEVKIYSDKSADPKKGSGILMVCSYGDRFDVDAINRLKLKSRIIFNKDGRLNELANKYKGLTIKEARRKIIEDLERKGLLIKKVSIKHVVNVHDKCGTEIEFLSSKQWFIRIMDNKKRLIDMGRRIRWHPGFMRSRYEHWVKGIQWDWCISRQRHFGVAFPLWYCKRCDNIIVADEDEIPLDPLVKKPKKRCRCGCNDFIGEVDVMDTWMTSSVTPQIALNWVGDKGYNVKFKDMYPMSLRPQAHDIIRTWAFYTIVKGVYHHNKVPWRDIVISGHIQDAKGRKMSKSLGNVIEPYSVLDRYGADAWRFMAASSRLGEDMPFQEKDLVTGQKLIIKLWNASRFCMMHLKDFKKGNVKLDVIDRWLLSKLSRVIKECSNNFDVYEYSRIKTLVESFFWHDFCDNYLEIVKDRLYNPKRRGDKKRKAVQYVLYSSLLDVIKLLAPIMPYIAEEIYQEYFRRFEKIKSVHLSLWPRVMGIDKKAEENGDLFIDVLSKVRREKSKRGLSLKARVKRLVVDNRLKEMIDDLSAVTNAEKIEFGRFRVEI